MNEIPKLQKLASSKKFKQTIPTELTDDLQSLIDFTKPYIEQGDSFKDVPWTDEHRTLFDDVSSKILTIVNDFNSQFVDLPKARQTFKQQGITLEMLADAHCTQTERPIPYSINTIKRALSGIDNTGHQYDALQLWLINYARNVNNSQENQYNA